jgi:hypothetical protein
MYLDIPICENSLTKHFKTQDHRDQDQNGPRQRGVPQGRAVAEAMLQAFVDAEVCDHIQSLCSLSHYTCLTVSLSENYGRSRRHSARSEGLDELESRRNLLEVKKNSRTP